MDSHEIQAGTATSRAAICFRIIHGACLAMSFYVLGVGVYYIFHSGDLLGMMAALLGGFVFQGACRRKTYAFQIASLMWLLVALSLPISRWIPSPEQVSVPGLYTTLFSCTACLIFFAGSVLLARHVHATAEKS